MGKRGNYFFTFLAMALLAASLIFMGVFYSEQKSITGNVIGDFGVDENGLHSFTGLYVDEEGWTIFNASEDTQIVYVSSSDGDDENCRAYNASDIDVGNPDDMPDGYLTTVIPCKSVSKGADFLRDRYPDWLLLKRGDGWLNEQVFNNYHLAGKSKEERMLFGSYGASKERPKLSFNSSGNAAIRTHGGGGADMKPFANLAFVGIHFYVKSKDISQPGFTGDGPSPVSVLRPVMDVLFEDNKFEYGGVAIQPDGEEVYIAFRRNVFSKSYSIGGHSQNLFTSPRETLDMNLLIEENVFYHGGWSDEFRMVLSNPVKDFAQWKSVSNGRFGINLTTSYDDGTTFNIVNVDFTGVNNMGDVAQVLEDAINDEVSNALGISEATSLSWTGGGVFVLDSDIFPSGPHYKIIPYSGSVSGSDIHLTLLNSSSQGVPESTIFNRNMYLSSSPYTILVGNIDADGASGGVQMRAGGVAYNNLFLQNAHAITFGSNQNREVDVTGKIIDNVVLGTRNINTQVQGRGFVITSNLIRPKEEGGFYGPSPIVDVNVSRNIIAHATLGTGNIAGIFVSGDAPHTDLRIQDNIIYNWAREWTNPEDHRANGVQINADEDSSITYTDNIVQQPNGGFVAHSGNNLAGVIEADGNIYYSSEQDPPAKWSQGWFSLESSASKNEWLAATGETNTKFEQHSFSDPERTIETYMGTLGESESLEAFMEKALEQSRFNWDTKYTACNVNDYIREGFDRAEIGCEFVLTQEIIPKEDPEEEPKETEEEKDPEVPVDFWIRTHPLDYVDFKDYGGPLKIILEEREKAMIKYNGSSYYIGIREIDSSERALVEISDERLQEWFSLRESKTYDLDRDGTMDINITLDGIQGERAMMTVMRAEQSQISSTDDEGHSFRSSLIFLGIMLFLTLGILILIIMIVKNVIRKSESVDLYG